MTQFLLKSNNNKFQNLNFKIKKKYSKYAYFMIKNILPRYFS